MSSSEPVKFSTRLIVGLIGTFMRLLMATCSVRYVLRGDNLNRRIAAGARPVILCYWHNRLPFFGSYFHHRLRKERDLEIAIMISASRDGDLGTHLGHTVRCKVVRGSSSKGGIAGLRAALKVFKEEGRSILLLPDGSKGPLYKAKAGAITLAKLTGAEVISCSCWASDYWRIRSWDRMIVPKPFSRIAVTVSEPLLVDRRCDEAEVEERRQELEDTLNDLGRRAAAAFPDPAGRVI